MAILEVKNLGKSFGTLEVLQKIDFPWKRRVTGYYRFFRQWKDHLAALS